MASPEARLEYYRNGFPWEEVVRDWVRPDIEVMFKWDDQTRRNQTFQSVDTFRAAVLVRNPQQIHVAGVYRGRNVMPDARPLVFDIDMDAYKDLRLCGCGVAPKACAECWELFGIGPMRIMDAMLRDLFGYQRVRFVFSGRRGFHVWVMDDSARSLSREAREALVASCWFSWAPDRGFCLDMVDRVARPMLAHQRQLAERLLARSRRTDDQDDASALCRLIWPKLDKDVTTGMNHALRCPYSLHGVTGAVVRPLAGPWENPFTGAPTT